ncbi:GDSL-type esterase/lipase family protein [bacterium]|nr:GDSL-type esterase/lipase family protein [bacterium]
MNKSPLVILAMLLVGLTPSLLAKDVTTDKPGQFVRIELPKGGTLTLAEVEVISGGKNIAKGGKATQSSEASGGKPERGIDGNKSSSYGDGGATHTKQDAKAPWWEVDLGAEAKIDKIQIWNRDDGLASRLNDFKISILNAKREPVFVREKNEAPEGSITFDLTKKGKTTLLAHNGKPGKAAKKSDAKKKKRESVPEPKLWATATANVPADYRDPEKFAFQADDKVAMIGSGLAERMQYDGWMESIVQSSQKDKNLTFRNLGFSGDRTDYYPRNKGFTPIDGYLQIVKADVIFSFFGYNESFEDKPEDYTKKLVDLVAKLRAVKPNGESFPRIVLFSPIAHEDLGTPNLPDGKANNERLAAYTEATKKAAADSGVAFVDLFNPSQALYKSSEEPLTMNGIHLNEYGNKLVGEVIAEALIGEKIPATDALEPLREAVMEKNTNWFDRYRAVDGNDIWGSRSILKFVGDQTNGDVLRYEMLMLDALAENRDKKIWARADGGDLEIDDSNVPKPIKVVSNVGGKGNMSSSQKEGTVNYLTSEESKATMDVPDEFQINVFADEAKFPKLVNPVQMQVDAKGRVWAAVWPTYPKQAPIRDVDDSLLIFEDTDRDGVADKVIEFAKVANPLGFEFWNGGVIVASQPNLIFLKDTDGDDIADERHVIAHGIGSADTHHAANNLIYGPDGGIYWQSGIFLHNNIEHPWGTSLSTGSSAMYRFDPRRYTIATHGGNSPNPHGIAFDGWGYHYATDGTGGRAYQVRPDGSSWKMHPLLKKEVRPVPANEIVSSSHFPDEMQQDFLICNSIGFLGIKQYRLDRDGGDGRKFGEVWGEPSGTDLTVEMGGNEMTAKGLLLSGDKNFRPTDSVFGDDGALYVSDWANVIIGHMQHNIRDPNRDHKHGRIMRISHKTRPLQESVKIAGEPLAALMKNLEHPIDGVRHRTRIELSGRDTKEVIAACEKWMAGLNVNKAEDAHHLTEALWLHQAHNVRNGKLLGNLLKSPEPHARVAAQTVQHHWYNADPTKGAGAALEEDHGGPKVKSGILSDTDELTEIRIGTIVERMSYDVKELSIKAGKKIKLTFANPDFMPHNLLVVQPGSSQEMGQAAMAMGAEGFAKDFRPDSDKIIAGTKMLDNGEEETIEFTAPTKPGKYEFVCTFPGHFMLMKGVFNVK